MPEYWASKAAFEWWKSLQEETRQDIEQGRGPDAIDIYEAGILYGWDNPQWIPVEEELPKVSGDYIICEKRGFVKEAHYFELDDLWMLPGGALVSPTHWMPKPQPPRKED